MEVFFCFGGRTLLLEDDREGGNIPKRDRISKQTASAQTKTKKNHPTQFKGKDQGLQHQSQKNLRDMSKPGIDTSSSVELRWGYLGTVRSWQGSVSQQVSKRQTKHNDGVLTSHTRLDWWSGP
jgi:hypothetical protein